LPRVLPTRLTALQGSCPAPLFAADPARCPAASVVGVARASTPLLAGTLSGPVYLVAHGREGFPAPTAVLEGDGVGLQLSGSSTLERGGSTAISFSALPDVPLRSVELYLPRGPHSALTATASLCPRAAAATTARRSGARARGAAPGLSLPSELVGQNGAVLHRAERISVVGCPSAARRARR